MTHSDEWLYQRSVAAAKRYCGPSKARNERARATERVIFEMYRVGWMKGWRAGSRR